MFRKLVLCMFGVVFSGVAFGEEPMYQTITSEVFIDSGEVIQRNVSEEYVQPYNYDVPTWPLMGSDADVVVACGGAECQRDDAKIVSKSGADLIIQNNINMSGTGWSGGPNIVNAVPIPAGFEYECSDDSEMPLLEREMLEDDGGSVLAMSRSPRKNCSKGPDAYTVFAQRAGFEPTKGSTCNAVDIPDDGGEASVNNYVEEESPVNLQDQVRSWVVTNGQTLREVLKTWCDREGWDLVWTTAREYPIEASAVFKGRFVDVASALIRNFERATPIPYAKFYKGNRVLVVSTMEE